VAALAERYASFNDTVRHTFDVSRVSFAGNPRSPVTILLFVSTSCPLCKKVYKELYGEVTGGKLKARAKIGIKVFSARPGDLALLAARKFNKQSEFLLSLAGVEERISMKITMQKALEIGLPEREFRALLQDTVLTNEAQASALEGERNGVTVTPTVFIDNKRYRSYKDPKWIVDAALYEYESLTREGTRESH
jgi:protein-disulfide isomerase